MMVSCLCCSWFGRHVIEIQEIGLKKFRTELQRVVGLHQILAGNVITCLKLVLCPHPFERGVGTTSVEPLVNAVSRFERKIFFLGLSVTVTEINIKKVQKEDLKNIKNVEGCRDGHAKKYAKKVGMI